MPYCDFCASIVADLAMTIPPGEMFFTADGRTWKKNYNQIVRLKGCDFGDSVVDCILCPLLYQGLKTVFRDDLTRLDQEGRLRRMTVCWRHSAQKSDLHCRLTSCEIAFNYSMDTTDWGRENGFNLSFWAEEGIWSPPVVQLCQHSNNKQLHRN